MWLTFRLFFISATSVFQDISDEQNKLSLYVEDV